MLHQRRRRCRRLATDPLELAALRESEQRAAAAEVVGYAGITFLHQPDGALANDLALREQLVREIRTFRPDAVLAVDPETLFYDDGGVNHTDHRAAGFAAVDAVPRGPRRDGVPVARPRRPGAVQGTASLSVLVPAIRPPGSTSRRRSVARSTRCAPTPARSASRRLLEARIREWAREEGAAIGVDAAEALRVIVIEKDEAPAEAAADGSAGSEAPAEA